MKINKTILSAVLATAALGLTANANAVNADAEAACPGCHGVVINNMQAVGSGGGRNCAQRTQAEWVATIDRMNVKGCGANNVSGIATYLANFGGTTTTTLITTTTALITTTTAPVTTTTAPVTTTTAPVTTTTAPVTTTTAPMTTTTAPMTTTTAPMTTTTAPMTTTTAPVTTTVATTTTTTGTMCNGYVNGTSQYPYGTWSGGTSTPTGGTGTCHSFALDLYTGAHIVRDQAYCQKHIFHQNSKGNHVHAPNHPTCM